MLIIMILVMALVMALIMALIMVFVMVFVTVRANDRTIGNVITLHIDVLVTIGEIQASQIAAKRHIRCFTIIH